MWENDICATYFQRSYLETRDSEWYWMLSKMIFKYFKNTYSIKLKLINEINSIYFNKRFDKWTYYFEINIFFVAKFANCLLKYFFIEKKKLIIELYHE